MGNRVQGVLVRGKPDAAALTALERAYGYRLYELVGPGLWLIDLGIAEPSAGDRATIRAARPLAASYVDALRVLGDGDETLEQLAWLTAAAAAARQLRQPVLGFVSDDTLLDFATVVTPDGVVVIGDRLGQYLLRWEGGGALAIQPFFSDGQGAEAPVAPEELSLIPAVTLLNTEKLSSGYPLHGNVVAELDGFAQDAGGLGIGTRNSGPGSSLRLVASMGLEMGPWDRAAGVAARLGGQRP